MKRLYLSTTDKKLAGVCGGLGEYFDIDPTVVRLLFVVLGIITGIFPFVVGYLLAWLLVPRRPEIITREQAGVAQGPGSHPASGM